MIIKPTVGGPSRSEQRTCQYSPVHVGVRPCPVRLPPRLLRAQRRHSMLPNRRLFATLLGQMARRQLVPLHTRGSTGNQTIIHVTFRIIMSTRGPIRLTSNLLNRFTTSRVTSSRTFRSMIMGGRISMRIFTRKVSTLITNGRHRTFTQLGRRDLRLIRRNLFRLNFPSSTYVKRTRRFRRSQIANGIREHHLRR